jgi:hypothetical protein
MNVNSRSTRLFNVPALWNGLTLGPLATLSALLVVMPADAPGTGAPVIAALVGPTAIFLILALMSIVRRGNTTWWVSSALGAVVGTALVAAAILGTISGIAWMLSDPG